MGGICSESTKSHSPEEQVFIRMDSSQNKKRSLISIDWYFLMLIYVFMRQSFRASFFLKNLTKIILEMKALLCPHFPHENSSKDNSVMFEHFSCNSSWVWFVNVLFLTHAHDQTYLCPIFPTRSDHSSV